MIVHGQHTLQYNERDSTEVLHRNSKISVEMVDDRNIRTGRREGVVFIIVKRNHYKFYKNPIYRCAIEWNNLDAQISLIEDKTKFKNVLVNDIHNPFVKVL